MAWEDTSASSHVVFTRYNPANPPVLDAVVPTTTSSAFPVSLFSAGVPAPYLRVVWRAADAHINLGIFEGDSNLHNQVTTAQTTPYGPALYMPYLGWTGTDSAQSINVIQVSF